MKGGKQIFGIFGAISLIYGSIATPLALAQPSGEQRTFITTAYYSPLPDQTYYLTGSYESEIRLNGRGTNGADGTPVYPGMLAAPKTYPFGTQIYIDGLGMGTVHDRGGAIVPAGERGHSFDRIDIWMGHGEEGLARALNWGKRTVTGTVYWSGGQPNSFSIGNVAQIPLKSSPAKPPAPQVLKIGSKGDAVALLQKDLTELGHYSEAITGYYGEITQAAVLKFQLVSGVIGDASTKGAGEFGPRTNAALHNILDKKHAELLQDLRSILPEISGETQLGTQSDAIAKLQAILYGIGYFNRNPDGYFSDETKAAILAFQMDNGIVGSADSFGAGTFGPKTRSKLVFLLEARQLRLAKAYPPVMVTNEFAGEITPPIQPKTRELPVSRPVFPISNLLAVEFPAVSSNEPGSAFAGLTHEAEAQSATFD